MADLTPLKIEVAILEFVKVHLNTLSYLEMIWNLKMLFYDLFCDIFMIGQRNLKFEVNTRHLLLLD